jgi:hypothetical protein
MQGKLTYHQYIATLLYNRLIHYTGRIVKDAQVNHFTTQPNEIFSGIAVFNSYQYEQTL